MKVLKRNGEMEDMKFDKVTLRISNLTAGLTGTIDATMIAQRVCSSIYDGITTSEIDALSAEICVGMMTDEPDYEKLAARLTASNIQKRAPGTFMKAMGLLHSEGILADVVWDSLSQGDADSIICPERDSDVNYFGLKTLERGYLTKIGDTLIETPQYMFLRVAWGIHRNAVDAKETYDMMSRGYFIHATPTLFNAGTARPQMSSCFLKAMDDDSIDGIYETFKKVAQISKWAGGIGLHAHNIRANNSRIDGTNGMSDGIIPMLRVLNATARYVNQGGKRKGSVAVYIEPWHADVMEFLELRLNQGDEDTRCRDLFTALWIPDYFMERVKSGGEWHLFCPNEVKKAHGGKCLSDAYGDDFVSLYLKCVDTPGLSRKTIPAEIVWKAIVKSQIETGTPYMLFKDAANKKSNQKNIGVIKSSNLCTEIMEVSSTDETAVCNLASVALPKFVRVEDKSFDYDELERATRMVVRNLNKIIDNNYYPITCARTSNMRHRPIGIGIQGLADVFMLLDLSFDSDEARVLNRTIFEHLYYAAVSESMELAKKDGPYETFKGSPISRGEFQFDMWGVKPSMTAKWATLRCEVMAHGVRNSLLVAPMPTASTSQILGNNECFEPYTTNIYLRRTLAGEFTVVNKHLIHKLKGLGIWNKETKNAIVRANGSVQGLTDLDQHTRDVFRTVWEISQKSVIDMAADRGAFVDQSQSMNLFVESPSMGKISSMHMYAWEKGLKTGMYYLRTKSKSKAIQFTLAPCETCSA